MNLPRMAYDRAAEQAATHRKRGEDRCVTLRGPTTPPRLRLGRLLLIRASPPFGGLPQPSPSSQGRPCRRVPKLSAVANTDTKLKLLIYGLFQKGRVLAQDGVGSTPCGAKYPGFCTDSKGV